MNRSIFLLLLGFFFAAHAFSQDSLILINGKCKWANNPIVDSLDIINYQNEKGRDRWIDKDEVFAIKKGDLTEIIIYNPDSSFQLTTQQMRDYVRGIGDARRYYKDNLFARTTPYVIGFASPMVMPLVGLMFVSPVLPAGYSLIMAKKNIKSKNFQIPERYISNQNYIDGYTAGSRKKRLIKTLIGSGIGLLLGSATAILVYENQ